MYQGHSEGLTDRGERIEERERERGEEREKERDREVNNKHSLW